MIIDSLTDKSAINIDKLTIPESAKRQEGLFDPQRDLLPRDWEWMKNHLSELRQRAADGLAVDIQAWASHTRSLVLLAPEHRDEFGIDKDIGNKLFDLAKTSSEGANPNWLRFIETGCAIRILYPDRISDLHLDDNKFESVLKELRDYHSKKTSFETAWAMFKAAEVFPNRVDEILAVDGQLAEVLTVGIGLEIISKRWRDLLFDAAVLKILFPQQEFRLSLSSQAELRECFKNQKGELDPGPLAIRAFCMYVLAAEEVRIGPEGLVISSRKPGESEMQEKIPDMPIKRAF